MENNIEVVTFFSLQSTRDEKVEETITCNSLIHSLIHILIKFYKAFKNREGLWRI